MSCSLPCLGQGSNSQEAHRLGPQTPLHPLLRLGSSQAVAQLPPLVSRRLQLLLGSRLQAAWLQHSVVLLAALQAPAPLQQAPQAMHQQRLEGGWLCGEKDEVVVNKSLTAEY